MGPSSSQPVNDLQLPKAETDDYSDILPSRVLSAEQLYRFEAKSNMNKALKEIRERGILWNYTELFRDLSIAKLPELLYSNSYSRLPIYSFGCSTGQEPYSLHVVLREHFGADYHTRFPVTGYDLDLNCIEMARSGYLVVETREGRREMAHLLRWAKAGIVVEDLTYEKKLVKIPDHQKVSFARCDLREELFEFSEPVAIFLQNVLYHLNFNGQFAVMDRLCSLPSGSIVCLGSDTFTDRTAASVLCASRAFFRICELKNVLMRNGPSIDNLAT